MKWTMLTVTVIGTVAYAVIFFSQVQHDQVARAEAGDIARDPVEVVAHDPIEIPQENDSNLATLDADEVSDSSSATTVQLSPDPPTWEGKPWPAGVEAFQNGDFALAREALEVAVAEKENSAYRHYLLGLTYRRVGEAQMAATELERSLELAPGQVRGWVNLGRVRLELDDVEGAREAVDAALSIDLEFADAWQVLGRVELESGAFEEAAAAFAKATSKDAQHAWAWNNLGYARIQLERFEEAVEPLRQALATGTEEAVFYNNLGVALERTGQESIAATAFARAALLGHDPAGASFERIEEILVARGETVPSLDTIEALDAMTVAQMVPEIVRPEPDEQFDGDEAEVEVALDELLQGLDAREFEEFDAPNDRR